MLSVLVFDEKKIVSMPHLIPTCTRIKIILYSPANVCSSAGFGQIQDSPLFGSGLVGVNGSAV